VEGTATGSGPAVAGTKVDLGTLVDAGLDEHATTMVPAATTSLTPVVTV
jgi:hypothetical protein